MIHSAVSLLFTLFGVAALYIFLYADFIAAAQVIIYVGGMTTNLRAIEGEYLLNMVIIVSIFMDVFVVLIVLPPIYLICA